MFLCWLNVLRSRSGGSNSRLATVLSALGIFRCVSSRYCLMRWGWGPDRLQIQISLCQLFGFLKAEPGTRQKEGGR